MVKGAVACDNFFILPASAIMGGAQEVRVHRRYLFIYLFILETVTYI
jgi:hypothetical protein